MVANRKTHSKHNFKSEDINIFERELHITVKAQWKTNLNTYMITPLKGHLQNMKANLKRWRHVKTQNKKICLNNILIQT